MNSKRGSEDAAFVLIFILPVILIFGIRSCVSNATASADSSAANLFEYISSMKYFHFVMCALAIDLVITAIAGIIAGIAINDQDPDGGEIAIPIVCGFMFSLLALVLTAGNLYIMAVVNIGSIHFISAAMQDKLVRSLSGLFSLICVAFLIACINFFYFKSSEKPTKSEPQISKPQVQKTNRQLLTDKYDRTTKLISSLNKDKDSVADKINDLNQHNKVDKIKIQILEDEKSKIEGMISKALEIRDVCSVLITKYDSAERVVKRNRELGKIGLESKQNLENINVEIKRFLKESKEISIKLEN